MREGRKRREDSGETKYSLAGSRRRSGSGSGSGIPAGSKPSGGGGGGSGIPAGSRAGGGARGGSGIPAGSRAGGGGRGGSGIPAGSSVRGKKRRGGSGVPAGSKSTEVGMESKTDQSSMLENVDEEKGIVEAYVSVTGVEDNVGDIIEPGAYAKTLQSRTPKGVWSHRWEEPVSKTLAIKEVLPGDPSLPDTLPNGEPWPSSAGALYVKTQFNLDSDIGRRAFSNVKFFSDGTGDDTAAWSIGYKATKTSKDKKGVRHIKELDLYEYSPVLHGANSHAKTLSVKSLDEAIEALHVGGYDTSELDVKSQEPFDGLTRAEIKAIPLAIDILNAYADELGLKRAAPVGDPDLEDPGDDRWVNSDTDGGVQRLLSLTERLEQVMVADDYPELLQAADAFDQAVQAGDDDAIADTVQEFLEVFEAEEADDPDDPDGWDGLRDVVADCLDDANELLYGIPPDDDDGPDDDLDSDEGEADGLADDEDAYFDADSADMPGGSGEDAGSDGEAEPADGDAGKSTRRGEVKSPSAAKRNRAESSGAAMSGGKYPIENASDLRKAIRMRGMGSADSSAINAHIKKRARALGLTDMLPDDLKDSGSSGSSSSGKSDEPFVLPDMDWAEAAFKAIDFGDAHV